MSKFPLIPFKHPKSTVIAHSLCLMVIVSLSLMMRLPHLETSPNWYCDEGTNYNLAVNIINGRAQSFASEYDYVPRLPLYPMVSGLWLKVFGEDIYSFRLFHVTCGVITAIFAYFIGFKIGGIPAGLISGICLSVWPYAALFNRWGMSNNLTSLLLIAATWFLIHDLRHHKRWAWLGSCFIIGLSGVTELIGLFPMAFVFLFAPFFKTKWDSLLGISLLLLPFGLFFTLMSFLKPNTFQPEIIEFILNRTNLHRSFRSTTESDPLNYLYSAVNLFNQMGFVSWLGLSGFIISLKNPICRRAFIVFIATLIPILMANENTRFRLIIAAIPFCCIGIGCLFFQINYWLKESSENVSRKSKYLAPTLTGFIIGISLAPYTWSSIQSSWTHFETPYDQIGFTVKSAPDARKTAEFLNLRLHEEDVVIAPEIMTWLLNTEKIAVIFESIAATKTPTLFRTQKSVERVRFAFNPRLSRAKYLVLDPAFYHFNVRQNGVTEVLSEVRSKWEKIYDHEGYTIFENPNLK